MNVPTERSTDAKYCSAENPGRAKDGRYAAM
jgi:hypothetical protein